MNLRFLPRDGQLILQFQNIHKGWCDVDTAKPESTEPKEFWLSCGRYFENKEDAVMFSPDVKPLHVKEVK